MSSVSPSRLFLGNCFLGNMFCDQLCCSRKLEQELEQKNQLESHIKIKDSQIMALKGQLVGAAKAAPATPSVS